MEQDPVIARIRQVRHRISDQHGHDAHRLVEFYIQLQAQHPERLLPERPESESEPDVPTREAAG